MDESFWKVVAVALCTVVCAFCGLLTHIVSSAMSTLTRETRQNTIELAICKTKLEAFEKERG